MRLASTKDPSRFLLMQLWVPKVLRSIAQGWFNLETLWRCEFYPSHVNNLITLTLSPYLGPYHFFSAKNMQKKIARVEVSAHKVCWSGISYGLAPSGGNVWLSTLKEGNVWLSKDVVWLSLPLGEKILWWGLLFLMFAGCREKFPDQQYFAAPRGMHMW